MVGTIKPSPQTTVIDVACGLLGKWRLARELEQLVQLKVKQTADLAADHRHRRWWSQVLP